MSELKTFEIWSEGYRATGESGSAHFHNSIEAKNFEEAILRLAIQDPSFYKHLSIGRSSDPEKDKNFYTYWGCELFDNESEARKSFG